MNGRAHLARDRVAAAGPPLATLALGLVAWQVAAMVTNLPTLIAPAPADVATALVRDRGALSSAAATTVLTAGGGLAFGVLLGGTVAFLMVEDRTVARLCIPYLLAARIAPLIALAPLAFFWLGDGIAARTALVATMTPFPIALASFDGLRSVPRSYLDLARSVDAPAKTTFLRVRVPAAVPSIRAGVQLAGTLGVIGAVVTEFLALRGGLGFHLYRTTETLDTAAMVATLLVVSTLGVCFYALPGMLVGALWSRS